MSDRSKSPLPGGERLGEGERAISEREAVSNHYESRTPSPCPLPGGEREAAEQARKLFAGPIEFLKSAPDLRFLPEPQAPEIAFAGRSNVGKSSLLNALANRKGLARTSNTPGRTQELNFFDVGEPLQLRLVDMPGYGFAEAPKDLVKRWKRVVNDYLRGREPLKRALVLVDARHGLKDADREMMRMLDDAAVSYHIVLTKSDKVKPSALGALYETTLTEAAKHPAAHPAIFTTSSETGSGIAELRTAILEAATS
jgi:GTP-binding protein